METIYRFLQSRLGVAIITAIVTAALSTLFFYVKLRMKQKVEFKKVIGKRIADALISVWDLLNESKTIENYELVQAGTMDGIKAFDQICYPAIMNDDKTLYAFFKKVNNSRSLHEKYLSRKAAAHMFFMNRYLLELIAYIKQNGLENAIPEVGCAVIFDFEKWQKSFEKVIVKEINKNRVKIQPHKGRRWEYEKKKLERKLYKGSVLVLLQKDFEELTEDQKEIRELLDQIVKK